MNKIELSDAFAEMWRQSREDAGRSQDYMAKALGVSKKTIQNWESGLASPSQVKGFEWFDVLQLEPLPYYLKILYPLEFKDLESGSDDDQIEDALIRYVKGLRPEDKRKLLFVIYGEHGSSFSELIEMLTAHFHTPDENRITVAQNICTNFEIAKARGKLVSDDHIMPEISILKRAIIRKRARILGLEELEG